MGTKGALSFPKCVPAATKRSLYEWKQSAKYRLHKFQWEFHQDFACKNTSFGSEERAVVGKINK